MEIGQKIKAVRLKLHMSQTEFAQLFGVSFATVNRWENGKTTPNYRAQRTFEQLCKEKNISEALKLMEISIEDTLKTVQNIRKELN